MFRLVSCLFLFCAINLSPSRVESHVSSPAPTLEALIAEALAVDKGEAATPAFAAAAAAYRAVLEKVKRIDRARLGLDDRVDYDLLVAHVRTRLFEMETLRLHEVNPASVFALDETDGLFLRPGALPTAQYSGR